MWHLEVITTATSAIFAAVADATTATADCSDTYFQ
jgi:hypothetical protein